MSEKEGREIVAHKPLRRTRSSMSEPPAMSDVMIIVLLGKSVAENSRVGNFILGRAAFDSEAPPDVVERVGGRLKDRYVMLVNSPQLLQTNLSDLQIIQTVRECVSLSAPGPHVIVLLLKHEQCSTEDQEHVKKLQDSFSEQLFQHTMVLSTEESNETNDILQEIIQKCSNRHFSLQKSSPDDLLQAFKVNVKKNDGRRLVCAQYENYSSAEREDELRIVLLGKTGVGKSATGNTILERDAFKAELSQELVTKECQRETCEINGRNVTVIDTPGLFDTELTNEEIQREISNCISMILPGPHVFIIVLNLGQRFTQEEEKSVKILQEMFGENSLMFTMVLFTRGDDLNKNIEQCLGKPGSALMKLIEACGNRYHVFNNNQTGDRTQVTDLLEKIDVMVKENGGSYYSCKVFRQMEREKQEQQMKILIERVREKEEEIKKLEERMKMMEEERQNQDKEGKRKEEEMRQERETFRYVIEEMRQEKEKIKTEKEKLHIKHNTEIEKLKLEEKIRREEEDEKRKEKDQRVWDEFNERLKQEREKMEREKEDLQTKHEAEEKKMETQMEKLNREREELMMKLEEEKGRMKMMMKEEQQNYDEERKRREEELGEIVEWFNRETKEQEEKERESHEIVKRERGEWEKQEQEEKMRREGKQISDEQIQRLKTEMKRIIREKERTEREKQEQREDFEKKLKEERNMRENEKKTFKEQLKLLKEQHKDELKRKREEWRKEYEREKENEKKIFSETDDSLQGENKEIQDLFDRLCLDKHHNKLTPADVPQINEGLLQSQESCAEEELIQTFLQNLLMMNYRAKKLNVRDPSEQDQTQQTDSIHPMDVQMAVFHCADGFLKQLMVTKLSQCQYALPLLVPDPFKQQIELPLWTFRQINKSWKMRNTNNETISQTQLIYKAQTPMVSFFRFGSVSSSKSQLMNSLINEKHNTFFHKNGSSSSTTRLLMDGVVEIAWFCPSGSKDDQFTECVAFCNLHGDAEEHEKQLQILTEMASVNVVLLPQLDRTKVSKDIRKTEFEKLYEDSKPLICLFPEDLLPVKETSEGRYKIGMKGRNQSEVSEELRTAINKCLSESSSTFRLEDVSKHSDIRVDEEDDEDCKRGREAAQQMMSLLEKKDVTEIKESFLPHQGKLWHQWSQKNRELHRPRADETETDLSRKQTEMEKIRKRQHESNISEFTNLFIKEMSSNDENMIKMKMFFLKWLRILLDEYTTTDLSALHHKYDETQSTVLKLKENESEQLKAEQTELERISEDLRAAAFGLEHIVREIGQIYESCSSVEKNKKDLWFHYYSLPSLAAEMMISGFPLELMDGDAAHVPVIWISAVLDELIQTLGDQRVFVLSVLGLQSSGKSTMLNAMFGLQFDVSAGRCTRGAFMQLVKVSDEMKTQMNIDYILVIDTEGLRALELSGRSTGDHDNELATFVVGLANMTLINIFGENPSDMQDILQIVAQAFVRMKKKVRLNPSCVFVHQNILDITAGERNEEERTRLQEKLDKMTKHAAEYFAHLWEGNPPMAPPNPIYCENIQELKTTIMSHGAKSHEMMLDIKDHITDLWEALLKH